MDDLINQGQVKVTPGKNDLAGFANLVITKILIYDSLYVFEGKAGTPEPWGQGGQLPPPQGGQLPPCLFGKGQGGGSAFLLKI